jgi:hypothetical protein
VLEMEVDSYTTSQAGRSAVGGKGNEKMKMVPGKGTGRAGRPPLLMGKERTAKCETLSTKITASYHEHKH